MEAPLSAPRSPRSNVQATGVDASSPTGPRSPFRMNKQSKTSQATDGQQQGSSADGASPGHNMQGVAHLAHLTPPAEQNREQQQEPEEGPPMASNHSTSPALISKPQQTATKTLSTASLSAQQPFSASKPTDSSTTTGSKPRISLSPLSSTVLPAVGTSDQLSSDMLGVLGAWYAMYCPDREAQLQAAVMTHYDPKARFEDNFIEVFGREQIGVQFYGMRRLVKGINVTIEKVEVLRPHQHNTSSPAPNGMLSALTHTSTSNTYQLRIVIRISFVLPSLVRGPLTSWFLPPALVAWATDILEVRESDNKIVHHQQRVHNVPVVPWPLRCCLGVSSSLFMMHALGW